MSGPAAPANTAARPRTEAEALDHFLARLEREAAEGGQEAVYAALNQLDPDFLYDLIEHVTRDWPEESIQELRAVAVRMEEDWRPQTNEQLWRFVRDECGLEIPRKAVCRGHCAPFDFMSDVYFARGLPDKLAVGNRGSGKTQIVGALHAVNARTRPGFTAATVGAVEAQAQRCYNFFRAIVTSGGRWAQTVAGRILMGGTETRGGGKVEIVTGTVSGVNSPHPVFAHLDEVELLRPGVYEEALNMAQSANGYQAQNVLTSSWKKSKGLVSDLVDDARRAEREGRNPQYQVYRWCVWETTAPCPHDCNACPFAKDVKGEWPDGSPRTFESACKKDSPQPGIGKLKFTDGFVPVEDAVARFRKLSARVWTSQQESKQPTMEGLIYDNWDPDRFELPSWDPKPEYGVITTGLDFGGHNPHAGEFWQHLDVEVEVRMPDGTPIRIPEGADVLFDMVYETGIGNVQFAMLMLDREAFWRSIYPDFRVSTWFRDSTANAAGHDLATLARLTGGEYPSIPTRGASHPVDQGIGLCYERIDKALIYVAQDLCQPHLDELGGYELRNGRPVKEDDHAMDAKRYRMWGVHAQGRVSKETAAPSSVERSRAVGVAARREREGRDLEWNPHAMPGTSGGTVISAPSRVRGRTGWS